MIKLHGILISNYYNTAKAALLEKELPFTEVNVIPSQKPEVISVNPIGKVPWLDVDGLILSETNVIFDYLEDIAPSPPLYPADPLARAKVKELIRVVELYIDAPARRHLQAAYFGAPVDATAMEQVKPAVEQGLRALQQLGRFDPWIAGDTFSFADITAYFQLRFAQLCTSKIYDWDFIADNPSLASYIEHAGKRPSIATADAMQQAAFEKMRSRS